MLNINFGLVDVSAKQDTTALFLKKAEFIDPQDLSLEGVYAPKAATLEKDYWKLDGTFKTFPDNPEDVTWGIWSDELCGENCLFTEPLELNLTFNNLHSSIGLTFEFNPYDNSYCNDLNIKWYKDDGILYDVDFTPDNWRYSCMNTVENYNKIIITFNRMNKPYRYLKVQNIMHGILKSFANDDITKATILEEVDLSSRELSSNALEFSVVSDDEDFNIFNPKGVYSLLQKKQQITVEDSADGIDANLGTFYVSDWESENENMFNISAVDAIGVMDGTYFNGGYFDTTAGELAEIIMNDAGFGYSIDNSLTNIAVKGYLKRCSHREAIQQLAFAIGGIVDTSRSGTIKIIKVPDFSGEAIYSIDRERYEENPKIRLRAYVNGVDVAEHTFTQSGDKYEDSVSIVSARLSDIEAGEKENIISIEGAFFVSPGTGQEAAQRVLDYSQKRIEQELFFELGQEKPGALVSVEVSKNTFRNAVIESMEIDAMNMTAKAVAVGE